MKKFIHRMNKFKKNAVEYYNDDKRLIMTVKDTMAFNRAMKCRFSHAPFEYYPSEKGLDIKYKEKVRDHDLLTTRFRGSAPSSCKFPHHKGLKIPIFLDNVGGYDSHLIATPWDNIEDKPISVIAQRMEKYLTLSLSTYLTFKDMLKFIAASLE